MTPGELIIDAGEHALDVADTVSRTVRGVMPISSAMLVLEKPWATSLSTCRCLGVNRSNLRIVSGSTLEKCAVCFFRLFSKAESMACINSAGVKGLKRKLSAPSRQAWFTSLAFW